MRALESEDFSDYECYINFTEDSYVDTTLWTFITHSASTIIYFMAATKLYFFPHSRLLSSPCDWSHKKPTELLVPLFLCVSSISHFLAALHTLTVKSAEDMNPLMIASKVYDAIGNGLIFSLTLAVMDVTPECDSKLKQNLWFLFVTAATVAPIWAAIYNFEVIKSIDLHFCFSAGYYLLLPLAYASRIFETIEKTFEHCLFTKFFSFVAILVAMSYARSFYWKCGSYVAYQTCFGDCPLPRGMNQTSFFNIAKLVALFCWAWAEDQVPSVCLNRLVEPEDDPTEISDGFDSDYSVEFDKDNEDHSDIEHLEEQTHSFESTGSSITE